MYIPRRKREDTLYYRLQEEALQMAQQLCGKVWTDYNPHDPGITILDHLHYALLEVDYELKFPFPDYLPHRQESREPDFRRAGLQSSGELFSPSLTTPADYEKQLRAAFPQIVNCRVWCDPSSRYHICIETLPDSDPIRLQREVTLFYHSRRNLGETLGEIRLGEIRHPEVPAEEENLLSAGPSAAGEELRAWHQGEFVYSSLQNDFPDGYGVNRQGMPCGLEASHRAAILQLKGYLSQYDYVLQAVFSQVNGLSDLLAVDTDLPAYGFTPIDLPDAELLTDLRRMRETVPVDSSYLHRQRSLYLDLLDRMYGEDTRYLLSLSGIPVAAPEEENRRRVRLLRWLPLFNRHRARTWNLLDPASADAVICQTLELLLLPEELSACSLTSLLAKYELRFRNDERFFSDFSCLFPALWQFDPAVEQSGDYQIREVPEVPVRHHDLLLRRYSKYLYFFCHDVVPERFLLSEDDPARYRVATRKGGKDFLLLFRCTDRGDWLPLGFFPEQRTVVSVVACLREFVASVQRQSGSFYLVEHVLLHAAVAEEEPAVSLHEVSFVFPAWHTCFLRQHIWEELIRERLPAHLTPCFHWAGMEQMLRFEELYLPWHGALAGSDTGLQQQLSRQLVQWLHTQENSL